MSKNLLQVTAAQKSQVVATLKACLQSEWKELEEIFEQKDEQREKEFAMSLVLGILILGAKEFVELCKAYPNAVEIDGDEKEIIRVLDEVVQKYRKTQKFEDLKMGKLTQPLGD